METHLFGDTDVPSSPRTSVASLLANRSRASDRVAFVEGTSGRTLTWRRLRQRAVEWQVLAESLGDRGGISVGLVVGHPLELIGCLLGALAAGVGVAPLNPDATPTELTLRGQALGLSTVVTDHPAQAAVMPAADVWVTAGSGLHRTRRGEERPRPVVSGGAAVAMASSGTTGEPKIVALAERQLLYTAGCIVDHHRLDTLERGYSPLPLFHINALVVGVLSTLIGGGTLVVDRRFSARGFWATVARERVTWLNLVPAILAILGSGDKPDPEVARRIRFARSASAPLAPPIRDRFEAHCGVGVLETYGMTEAASQITANPLQPADRRPGSVGPPVGVELRVVDGSSRPVPAGVVGSIEIRGESVVSGYWSRPGRLPAVRPALSPEGWLATGDLGRIDSDGFVYLVGRADDVINRGGEKIYPREIEDVLVADPGVRAAVVVSRPSTTFGEEPIALVVAESGVENPDDLPARLARRTAMALSRWKQPAAIVLVRELPVSATGKIRRGKVRRLLPDTSVTANIRLQTRQSTR